MTGRCLVCGGRRGNGSLVCGACGVVLEDVVRARPVIVDDLRRFFWSRIETLRQLV